MEPPNKERIGQDVFNHFLRGRSVHFRELQECIPLGSLYKNILRFGTTNSVTSCNSIAVKLSVACPLYIMLINLHHSILNKYPWRSIQFVVCLVTVKTAISLDCQNMKFACMQKSALLTFSNNRILLTGEVVIQNAAFDADHDHLLQCRQWCQQKCSGGAPTDMTLFYSVTLKHLGEQIHNILMEEEFVSIQQRYKTWHQRQSH